MPPSPANLSRAGCSAAPQLPPHGDTLWRGGWCRELGWLGVNTSGGCLLLLPGAQPLTFNQEDLAGGCSLLGDAGSGSLASQSHLGPGSWRMLRSPEQETTEENGCEEIIPGFPKPRCSRMVEAGGAWPG